MYEDRTYDVIMSEMMSNFGQNVRTDSASLAYNACSKIALALEEFYGDMSELSDNMLPDTQDLAHLIDFGRCRGIYYEEATNPIVKGVFSQEIEIGERFYCNDYIYSVIAKIDGFQYRLQCEEPGATANANFGNLTPVDFIDNYLGGSITELLVAGIDDEDEEVYRNRVISSFQVTAFSGNKADYRRLVNAIPGIGGCKPRRRNADSPVISIRVITSDYTVPSSELIQDAQTIIDPLQNSGEGDGLAPICHSVLIEAVEGVTVNVGASVTFDTGYNASNSNSSIAKVISDYLSELRGGWQSLENDGIIVRITQLESRILSVEGVLDVNNTTINGNAGNLLLQWHQVPVMGGVSIV